MGEGRVGIWGREGEEEEKKTFLVCFPVTIRPRTKIKAILTVQPWYV